MAWPEEIADGLPAPRDDEPASLRQDIVDELSDHLHCALHRELHRGHAETKARQDVIQRFGNPARIAYGLWFDAMKERIMSQRVTMAAAILMAIACLFIGVVSWNAAQRAQETSAALLEQGREANRILIEKLSAVATTPQAPQAADWSPVQVRLVTGTEKGAPAQGFHATISNLTRSDTSITHQVIVEGVSDSQGHLDFGLIPNGTHFLSIKAPWGERLEGEAEYGLTPIFVQAGRGYAKTLICPTEPQSEDVVIEIDWPSDLRGAKLWAYCNFSSKPFSLNGMDWGNETETPENVFVTDTGSLIDLHTFVWREKTLKLPQGGFEQRPRLRYNTRARVLKCLTVLLPPSADAVGKPKMASQFIASYDFVDGVRGPEVLSGLVTLSGDGQPLKWESSGEKDDGNAATSQPAQTFEVKPGQPNRWKVAVPPSLVAYVREQLKAPAVK